MHRMKPKPPSKSEGLRLTVGHWVMLRHLIQTKGRPWLEKLIGREHKKISPDA
jgi:hypothetical protein